MGIFWFIPIINSLWPIAVLWQHRSASILAQVLICCLMAPSHYLNQYWFLINEDWCHSPESNFMASTQATIRPNEVANYIFLKLLPHPPGVKELIHWPWTKWLRFPYAFPWKKGLYFDLKKKGLKFVPKSPINKSALIRVIPSKHTRTCLNWARTGPMLPASARFWPSYGRLWHVCRVAWRKTGNKLYFQTQ